MASIYCFFEKNGYLTQMSEFKTAVHKCKIKNIKTKRRETLL